MRAKQRPPATCCTSCRTASACPAPGARASWVTLGPDFSGAAPAQEGEGLWWAFALGADLGGNTTAVAAGANVVIIGIAAARGHAISFWTFTKYGLIVTAATLAVSWPYVWLRYYA